MRCMGRVLASELGIMRHIPLLVEALGLGVIAQRVKAIDRKIRVAPVDQRVVEADAQTGGAKSFDKGREQILAVGRACRLILGVRAIPEAEALVMFGGQHDITHTGGVRGGGPGCGIVEIGVEVVEIAAVAFGRDALAALHPLVASGQRVKPLMDKHTEAVGNEPARIPRCRRRCEHR